MIGIIKELFKQELPTFEDAVAPHYMYEPVWARLIPESAAFPQ